jgi:hypothetical protein
MLWKKADGLLEILRILKLIFEKINIKDSHEAPYTVAKLYGLPRGILGVFNTILHKNEFENP